MDGIGAQRQVFLLCDSWYPKGCVAGLVNEFHNLDIICNARIDTVMYDLPPGRTGKRDRPKKYGERLSPEDFCLESPKTGDWRIGVRPVLTRLWEERVVYTIVTLPKSGNGSRRLFFCTKAPESIIFDYSSARTMPYVDMGKKMNSSCHLPAICHAGILKYHTTKARSSGHWKNIAYETARVLSVW